MHHLYAIIVVSASVLIVGALVLLLVWLDRLPSFAGRFPFRTWGIPLILVLIAFLDGTLRHDFQLPGSPATVLGALNLFVIIRGLVRGTIWLAGLETAAFWCAWAFGWTAAHGGVDEGMLDSWFGIVGVTSIVVTIGLVSCKENVKSD